MARLTAEDATPVLVFGSGVTALGVCRVLGRSEIPAYLVSADRDFARWSRWIHPIEFGGVESPDPDLLESFLDPLPFERAVLIPCSDTWVRAVAGLSSETRERFRASVPSAGTVDVLADKGLFAEVIKRLEIPMPRTLPARVARDLDFIPDSELSGFFLKPRNSQAFSQHYRRKALPISDRSDAVALLDGIQRAGFDAVLQEYIPGPPGHHHFIDGFVDHRGMVRALFARQRLLMYPTDFGNSTLMVSEPLDVVEPAISDLRRLFIDLSFRGIFSAEFKLDPRDSTFKLLEVNGRPWWFIEFAAHAGVNIPMLAYEDALGRDVMPPTEYEMGVRHMAFDQHLRALVLLRKRHELTVRWWLRETWGAGDAVLKWSDPFPWIAMNVDYLRMAMGRRRPPIPGTVADSLRPVDRSGQRARLRIGRRRRGG